MQLGKLLMKTVSPLALAGTLVVVGMAMPANVSAQNSNPEAAAALGPIEGEIRFSWWGGQLRNEKTDQILQLFEAENPGVTVARENADFAPHWERLTIQSAGNNQPCTIQMQTRWLATFAKPEILRPLDDLVESGALNVAGIPQPVLDASRGADGNLYMIPSGVFYFSLMYNKQLAEAAAAAGVPMLEAPYSWTEFADYLRAIKPHLPAEVSGIHNMGREPDAFVTWVQSQGEKLFEGSTVAFTPETAIAWFNYWETLRKEGLTESPEEMVTENSALVEESNLANGRGFATNRPPNQLGSVQKIVDTVNPGATIDIMQYPTGEDGTVGMDLGANGIAIGANCPDNLLPAAVAWVNFFTQDPRAAQIYQSDNGVVAIDQFVEAQRTNPETQPTQVRMLEIYSQVAPNAKPVFWPAGGYQALTDVLNRTYDAIAFEQISVEDGADMLITELNEQLANAAR
jgi:multiple sugar transport system substrate-binding protein